jgi:adenylate cyclase
MVSGDSPDAADLTEHYRLLLTGREPDEIRRRRLYARLPSSPRCRICNAPFRGPGGALMRLAGRGPFPKNPHLCQACFRNSPPGGCEIDVGALFVDVRGSSGLAERLGPARYAKILQRYYEIATEAMMASEAFIELTGDEVFGLYLPAFTRGNYASAAIETGERILRAVDQLNLGAGVAIGPAWVGTVGDPDKVRDFRALGDTINVGAGLVANAAAGECLITESAYQQAQMEWANLETRRLRLKGKSAAELVRVMKVALPSPSRDQSTT